MKAAYLNKIFNFFSEISNFFAKFFAHFGKIFTIFLALFKMFFAPIKIFFTPLKIFFAQSTILKVAISKNTFLALFLIAAITAPSALFAPPAQPIAPAQTMPAALPQIPVLPRVDLSITPPNEPGDLVTILNIVVVLTFLVLAPSLVLMATSFARLLIVFSFLRTAMGTQQSPPTQLLVSFALILTIFIMEPIAKEAYDGGIRPYLDRQIPYEEAFVRSAAPFKDFMIRNTRPKDLALFYRIRNLENPQTAADVPLTIALPAFIMSEMKTAFQIGFLLYLPFLVIDMVISSILMAMGMMMLPPTMISLPFKILVFILVDGFNLMTMNLVASFR